MKYSRYREGRFFLCYGFTEYLRRGFFVSARFIPLYFLLRLFMACSLHSFIHYLQTGIAVPLSDASTQTTLSSCKPPSLNIAGILVASVRKSPEDKCLPGFCIGYLTSMNDATGNSRPSSSKFWVIRIIIPTRMNHQRTSVNLPQRIKSWREYRGCSLSVGVNNKNRQVA